MSTRRPSLRAALLAGALFGLVAFALEAALILRDHPVGLNIDVQGPFAALMAAVRPHVPALLARVALGYAVAGAVAGLLAGGLVRLLALRRRGWVAWAAFAVAFITVVTLAVLDRSIARPALFDDLRWYRPVLAWLVDHGEVAHIRGLAALIAVAVVGAAVWRRRLWRAPVLERVRVGLGAALIVAGGSLIWAETLPDAAGGEAGSARQAPPSSHSVETSAARALAETLPTTQASPADSGAWSERPPRLILLIGIDAFRVDRLQRARPQGRPVIAPNLEALIADGTLFTNAWTPIAQTEPAWRSLLTARWPHRTGLRYPLAAESRWLPAPTFTAELARRGWRTTFATDCSRFNFQTSGTGFTERRQPPRGAINFVLEKMRFRLLGAFADNDLGAHFFPELIENRAIAGLYDPAGYASRLADEIADRAERGATFFAFHATAAHFPGDPSVPFYRRQVRADAPLERRLRMFFSPIAAGGGTTASGWGRTDSEALYDELLSQADAQLGVILSELRERGLYDDAAIIVFSDHGESFHADHPELGGATPVHGARLSREENQILLAVKLPRSFRTEQTPAEVDGLVRLLDVGPTILELAAAPPLDGSDGVSLRALLDGQAAPPRLLYAETGFTHASPGAFDAEHLAVAPRTFDIYRVRRDGVVELSDEAHDAVMREKDVGAFDGRSWIVRAPRTDGSVAERCSGVCPARQLSSWLDATLGVTEVATGTRVEAVPQ